jgi:fluoride exporter
VDDERQHDAEHHGLLAHAHDALAHHHDAVVHDRAAIAHERELRDRVEAHDLLDEPVLPLFGLSAASIAAIFVGGALGTVARYLLEVHHQAGPGSFPWVTLLVNLTGSFAIGALVPLTEHVSHRLPVFRPLLMIGFLGGWTTYSTLAVDATLLARHGDVGLALAYLAATVVGGLALVVAGHDLGRRLTAS